MSGRFATAVSLLLFQASASIATAGPLVINEVLYDPGGADAGREFVEIYNAGDAAIDLGAVELETGDGASAGSWRRAWTGPGGVRLEPGSFWSIGEESVVPPPQSVVDLDLQNGPDACRLILDGTVVDLVGWGAHEHAEYYRGTPADDVSGVSLGRVPDGEDSGDNGLDFAALDPPSPGEPNAFAFDLSLPLSGVVREPALPDAPGRCVWRITAVNAGLEPAAGASVRLEGGAAPAERSLPALEPGESATVEMDDALSAPGVAERLVCLAWPADTHASNDSLRVRFRAGPGPLLINEIAYAPPQGSPEWIEIVNASAAPVDPSGWSLGDSHDEPATLPEGVPAIPPGGFLVVSETPLSGVGTAVALDGWPSLNNTRQAGLSYADRLRLADREGLLSDEVAYAPDWGGGAGVTLERVSHLLPSRDASSWGSSAAADGGTPGASNSIAVAVRGSGGVSAEPSPFSPDEDGDDDRSLIAVEVPVESVAGSARIFDLAGRELRDLGALSRGRSRVIWDGRDAGGRIVPLGAYVVVASGRSRDGSSWRLCGQVVVASPLARARR